MCKQTRLVKMLSFAKDKDFRFAEAGSQKADILGDRSTRRYLINTYDCDISYKNKIWGESFRKQP